MDSDTQNIARLGAYAIILENNKFLLAQKKSGPYKGLWGLPGGGIEFGETPEIALKREIQEEAALDAHQLQLITVLSHLGSYAHERGQYRMHHIGIIYRAATTSPVTDRIPEEKTIWQTMPEIEIDKLTPFAKQAFINNLFQ